MTKIRIYEFCVSYLTDLRYTNLVPQIKRADFTLHTLYIKRKNNVVKIGEPFLLKYNKNGHL